MRILITGSDGYIGIGLTNLLIEEGHEVICVDKQYFINADKFFISKVKRPCNDLKDLKIQDLTGVDQVVHLASISNDPTAELDSKLTWETNVLQTMHLAELAIRANVKHITFASSGSVYGLKDEEEVTEDLDLMPITDYNKSKMCAERVLLSYRDKIGLTVVRPATVCGISPRQRLDVVVNMLTYQALSTGKIKLFGGRQIRPHINMKDMHDLYVEVINNPQNFLGIFNAGNENISNENLAKMIQNLTGAEIVKTDSADNRSYRLSSKKLINKGFKFNHTVNDAIRDLCDEFNKGSLNHGPETSSVNWLKTRL